MNDICVCGHIQQKNGIAWNSGGIHSVSIHRGHCDSSNCSHCRLFKKPQAKHMKRISKIKSWLIKIGVIFA